MREIIYIQAGKLSNYTGTHFWNAQETYLTEGSAETIYDCNLSFREGLSPTGTPTYCPRLLLFDHKSNFGTLSKSNALLGTNEDELLDEDSPEIWNGHVAEYRQDLIPKSAYHTSLDRSDDSGHAADQTGDTRSSQEDIRYWSDFNRVYYIPRTVQKLPDHAEWENVDGDWNLGQSTFTQYDEDHALMDSSFRLSLEECNSPQGLQIMNDTTSFGGFMNSFLTAIRDQYTKLPCLVVPFLSTDVTKQLGSGDLAGIRNVINDALYLRSLSETASITIPIQPALSWSSKLWNEWLSAKPENTYHSSAVVSAMLESVTVPLRLRGGQCNLSSLSGRLNWQGNTPFSELSGIFPFQPTTGFDAGLANLSAVQNFSEYSPFTRFDVSRGFTPSSILAYDDWSSRQSLDDAFISSTHTESYPLPTSYPALFKNVKSTSPTPKGLSSRQEQCSLFASLATSSQTAFLFSLHASAIDKYLKRKPAVETLGFDGDELRHLTNDLWTLHDNFDRDNDHDSGIAGEDEMI